MKSGIWKRASWGVTAGETSGVKVYTGQWDSVVVSESNIPHRPCAYGISGRTATGGDLIVGDSDGGRHAFLCYLAWAEHPGVGGKSGPGPG